MGLSNIDIQKRRLRARQRLRIKSLSSASRSAKARRILECLLRWDIYRKARKILLFASLKDEPDTWSLLKKSLRLKKQVYLPAICTDGSLGIYRVKNVETDLIPGEFDVWEPRKLKKNLSLLSKMDLALIPGLAFDFQGRRLGRGKGCYDRLLAAKKKPFCLGLAFEAHLVKKIPEAKNDQRVQGIQTEKALYYVFG